MEREQEFLKAVIAGDADKVKRFLEVDRQLVNAKDASGISAFMQALYHGRKQVAAILMVYGASQNLFEAAAIGNLEQVAGYLDKIPAMLNSLSNDGWTPLHLAAFFGHPRTVRLLLERGADPKAFSKNYLENTALHAASAAGRDEVVKVLLEAGVDPDLPAKGDTPLHLAAANGHPVCVELLLNKGARVNERNGEAKTPLGLALERGHQDVVDLLHLHEAIV